MSGCILGEDKIRGDYVLNDFGHCAVCEHNKYR